MKKHLIALSIGILAIFGIVFSSKLAEANQFYFMPTVQTATATSTVATVAPSTAATTLILDSYTYGTVAATDKATLLIQNTASTSSSQIKITLTYSQDGVDYFNNNLVATTTAGVYVSNLETPNSYSLLGNTTSSTTRVAISVPTPTRFVKATFTSLVATSTVWAQFVPQRQIK